MATRLGPGHHLLTSVAWIAAMLADHLEGDWPTIAATWSAFVADPQAGENGLIVDDAALAAYAHARSGSRVAARGVLDALTPVLHRLTPNDWLVNGAIAFAAAAIWWLDERDLAPAYRALARSLVAAGRGDYPGTSNELTVARMATLTGSRAEATEYFARARLAAATSGRRPLRAMVDLDEARSLLKLGAADRDQVASLAAAAARAFADLGMAGWFERAQALGFTVPGDRRHVHGLPPGRLNPGGLTDREVTVLQLVARGFPDRTISQHLELSPRTVQSHLRNMFRKTDTTNRTELSVWAVEHGLTASGSSHERR
jgi:DNA-binding CsgD family transcriptional regulator